MFDLVKAYQTTRSCWAVSDIAFQTNLLYRLIDVPNEFGLLNELMGIDSDIKSLSIGDRKLYTAELYEQKIQTRDEILKNRPGRTVEIAKIILTSLKRL